MQYIVEPTSITGTDQLEVSGCPAVCQLFLIYCPPLTPVEHENDV